MVLGRIGMVGALGIIGALFLLPLSINADSTDTPQLIQKAIDEHNAEIAKLNQDIAQFQQQLDAASKKKQTLQGTLVQLDISIKKTNASISLLKNQISATQLQIQQLSQTIVSKQGNIDVEESGLAQSLRALNQVEVQPLAAQILSSDDITTAWEDVDQNQSLQGAIDDHIKKLSSEKRALTDTRTTTESKKQELVTEQKALLAQQGSLNATKRAQSDLLKQTKAQESNFQAIIAEKKKQEASFESALNDLQSRLKVAINPSQITPSGSGVLQWPLDRVIITQYFGNTPFAASGAYAGKGHNGIDLAASIGTPVKAALSGVVIGTGNTDATPGCYSFGKWVFIKHYNGLSTIYAHLSEIDVSNGQTVTIGQVLGYSGETGYATGPHLHFGVYVSSAAQVLKLGDATKSSGTPCANVTMPVAPLAGYLNPLNYLPAH
jgi:murein DD-endopeptidase MepM/ murein hydrolase activator NlpD